MQPLAYNYRPPPAAERQPPAPPAKKRRRPRLSWLLLLAAVIAALGVYKLVSGNETSPVPSTTPVQKDSSPQPASVEGRYLFSGTIVLDRVVASEAGSDYNQPFSGMSTLGKFDERFADLECPVTSSSYRSVKGQEVPRFNCQPAWLPTLKKYFGVIKLAGNHTYDMGADGFQETIRRLQAAGIQTVGHYNPHIEKDNCEVVGLRVRVVSSDGKEQKGQLPIAVCAFNYKILFAPEPGEIEVIARYAKIMPVVGLLQAGAEYIKTAGAQQKTYARKMIDQGADFVIANGTHYVQDSEAYKGKLIVYSLGNFIFDQVDYETMRAVSIAVDMSVKYDQNVAKWLALGAKCQVKDRKDGCLAAAEQENLSKISLKYEFEPIGSSGGVRRITKRADATLQKAIEDRLNWPQTVSQLEL